MDSLTVAVDPLIYWPPPRSTYAAHTETGASCTRELLQTTGDDDHVNGRAVAIGNEEIAARLLPSVATAEQVTKLAINKIIFDAGVAGQADRNIWNIDSGVPHSYDDATLAAHRTDIYFAVNA